MKPFNVRVYALLEHKGKVLVIHEPFQGELIYKFPGGGLEFMNIFIHKIFLC